MRIDTISGDISWVEMVSSSALSFVDSADRVWFHYGNTALMTDRYCGIKPAITLRGRWVLSRVSGDPPYETVDDPYEYPAHAAGPWADWAKDPIPSLVYSHESLVSIPAELPCYWREAQVLPLGTAWDGKVWWPIGRELIAYHPETEAVERFELPAVFEDELQGLAIDGNGRIWSAGAPGYILRLDPMLKQWDRFFVGIPLWWPGLIRIPSGPTSARQGVWEQSFEGPSDETRWTSLSWTTRRPHPNSVQAYLRFASTKEGLARAQSCGPFMEPPVDLGVSCAGNKARFAEVEFRLFPTPEGDRPTVRDIRLEGESVGVSDGGHYK